MPRPPALVVLATGAMLLAPAVAAAPRWLDDLDAALASARSRNKPVFLDYYAAWCPPCQDLDREVLRSGALGPWESDFVFVHLDGDRLPPAGAFRKYPITGYPTVWILAPDGKPMGRYSGYQSRQDFLEFVSETLAGKDWSARLAARLEKEPQDAELLVEATSEALFVGDAQKAEALKKRIAAQRDGWEAAYDQVRIEEVSRALYAESPEPETAIRLAKAFLAERPGSTFAPTAAHLEAKALRSLGRAAAADALAAGLPARFPDSASAHWRLLEYSRLNGVLAAEAERALETGLQRFPEHQRFLTQAVLFLQARDRARAAGLAERLLALKPENAYYEELVREVGSGRKR